MHSLGDSLKKSLKGLGLEKKIREKRIVYLWDKLRQGELINHTQGAYFKNGILFVTVSSPIWSQQLIFLKNNLIRQINQELGGNILKDLRFQCGTIERREGKRALTEENWEKVFLNQEELKKIEETSEIVKEEQVREKLKSFLIKGKKLRKWREEKGWKVCPLCSCLYPPKERKCPFCSVEKEIKKLLFANPWLEFGHCSELFPGLSLPEFIEIKQKIRENLGKKLNFVLDPAFLEKVNQERAKRWLTLAQVYVILVTGLDLSAIDKKTIYSVLGSALADIFYDLRTKFKEGG